MQIKGEVLRMLFLLIDCAAAGGRAAPAGVPLPAAGVLGEADRQTGGAAGSRDASYGAPQTDSAPSAGLRPD